MQQKLASQMRYQSSVFRDDMLSVGHADDQPLKTNDRPKSLTTVKFKPYLELMDPCDSLSAVLKSLFNLQRDSVEVLTHTTRTNFSMTLPYHRQSFLAFNPSLITPMVPGGPEGQSIQTRRSN
ncbi:hypothetical protein P692DRAFT_20835014 [Suillus brevipes Sb2]|nr:hypothetical protein P692DRAFT_20835014 [Suillus brevipes Sb2]